MNSEVEFVLKIQNSIKDFNQSNKIDTSTVSEYSNFLKIITSLIDIFLLIIKLKTNKVKLFNIVYTGEGICHRVDNQYGKRILEPLQLLYKHK